MYPKCPSVTVEKVEYHRNGVAGVGFYVCLFNWQPAGARFSHAMVGIVFPEPGRVAILDRELLGQDIIGATEDGRTNKWRGDQVEKALRDHVNNLEALRAPFLPSEGQTWDDYANQAMGHTWFQEHFRNRNARWRAAQVCYREHGTEPETM